MICEKLEATGAVTFRDDRDIDGGDDIPERIRKEIIRSREVLVHLTPESVDRTWVKLEVGAAWGRSQSKRIVVILCHVPLDPIPDILKAKKAYSINDVDSYLLELTGRVRKAIQ